MKKLLVMLLVMCLLALGAAMAEVPVYQVLRGDTCVATGVLFASENTILTSGAALGDTTDVYVLRGGVRAPVVDSLVMCDGALVLLAVDEPSEEAYTLLALGDLVAGVGHDAAGEVVQLHASEVQNSIYKGASAVELTLDTDVLPGAVLLQGDLVQAVVAARCGEGEHRYVAIDANGINDELNAVLDAREQQAAQAAQATVTETNNLMQARMSSRWLTQQVHFTVNETGVDLDWSDVTFTADHDQRRLLVLMCAREGDWIMSMPVSRSKGETTASMFACPGVTYDLWVYAGVEQPEEGFWLLQQPYTFTVPKGEPFTDWNYHDEHFYLTLNENNLTPTAEEPLPFVLPTSAEALHSAERVDMFVHSTYQVTENVEYVGMVVLHTPLGDTLCGYIEFLLSPELNEADVWSLDVTPLLFKYSMAEGNTLPAGEYCMEYYYGSQPVSSFTFTLE